MTEAEFSRAVRELAALLGYSLQYHTYDSRRSAYGFPDLVLVNERRGRVVALELKREKAKATAAQWEWVNALNACGVPAFVVWPRDFDAIHKLLEDGDRSALDARV